MSRLTNLDYYAWVSEATKKCKHDEPYECNCFDGPKIFQAGFNKALQWVMEEMRRNNEEKCLEAWMQLAALTQAIDKKMAQVPIKKAN